MMAPKAQDTYGQRKVRAMLAEPGDEMPADPAAERSVIADLLEPEGQHAAIDAIRDVLDPCDFSVGALGALYEAICGVRDQQAEPAPIGHIEIGAWLRSKELAIGVRRGGAHLTNEEAAVLRDAVSVRTTVESVSSALTTRTRIEARAATLRSLAEHRRLIGKMLTAATTGFATDPAIFRETALELAVDIQETLNHQRRENMPIGEALKTAITDLLRPNARKPDLVTTGIENLDSLVHLEPGALMVIGARSGVGKSSLSMQIAVHVGEHWGHTLYFSSEMKAEKLALRAACSRAKVDWKRLERGYASQAEKDAVALVVDDVARGLTCICDDSRRMIVPDIIGNARRHNKFVQSRGGRLRLVVVDYLQRVDPAATPTGRNRENDIAWMAKAFKDLAMELDCCVIVPCQLNKEGDKRTDTRPRPSDARESSGIENEADQFLLIHNPEYNDRAKRAPAEGAYPAEACEIIAGKVRSGGAGVAHVWFHPTYTSFSSMTPAQVDDNVRGARR